MADPDRVVPAMVRGRPNFDPSIGDAYRAKQRAMLADETSCCEGLWHLMGESHYDDVIDNRPNLMLDAMRTHAIPGYPFFDTILAIATGQDREALDREDWDSFAFSNFVQKTLQTGYRPDKRQWKVGAEAFFAQLAITRPKQLLVIGAEQWDNLPCEGFLPIGMDASIGCTGRSEAGVYIYEVDGKTAVTLATWVYHPSAWQRLDVDLAKARVRELTMIGCNVISDLQRDGDAWRWIDWTALRGDAASDLSGA